MRSMWVWVGVVAAALYFVGAALGVPWLCWLTKPLPVVAMAVHLDAGADRYRRTLRTGLLLSMVGDVLLMVPGTVMDLFLPGLVAFLLAHVAYIVAFSRGVPLRPLHAVPGVLVGGAAALVVVPRVGPLAVPVAAYVLTIVAMAWRALACVGHGAVPSRAAWAGAAGAFLFLASDATLAVNRFVTPLPAAGFLVMSTYWAAQLGITLSGTWRPR